MPNYDYYCPKCDARVRDVVLAMDDRHTKAPPCPQCQTKMALWISGCLEAHTYRKHGFPERDRGMGRRWKTWEEKKAGVESLAGKMAKMGYEMEVNL